MGKGLFDFVDRNLRHTRGDVVYSDQAAVFLAELRDWEGVVFDYLQGNDVVLGEIELKLVEVCDHEPALAVVEVGDHVFVLVFYYDVKRRENAFWF